MSNNRTDRLVESSATHASSGSLEPLEAGKSLPRTKAVFVLLALLMAGLAAGRQVSWWSTRVRYPGELDTVEGRELADMVRRIVGFQGQIIWDKSKPDGTPRKLMDSSRLFALGWKPQVDLETGIRLAYEDFLNHTNPPTGGR